MLPVQFNRRLLRVQIIDWLVPTRDNCFLLVEISGGIFVEGFQGFPPQVVPTRYPLDFESVYVHRFMCMCTGQCVCA